MWLTSANRYFILNGIDRFSIQSITIILILAFYEICNSMQECIQRFACTYCFKYFILKGGFWYIFFIKIKISLILNFIHFELVLMCKVCLDILMF